MSTSNKFNMEAAIEVLNYECETMGWFSVIDKGFQILPEEYHDFWRWLFDDKDFFVQEELSKIGGYVLSVEMQDNKRKLYEFIKSITIDEAWELPELSFCYELPICSYEECRRGVAVLIEKQHQQELEELYAWSEGFQKFVCHPLSAIFIQKHSIKELAIFCRTIEKDMLVKAMVLYTHSVRWHLLQGYSDRLQKIILGSMKSYVKGDIFSLEACVEAEENIRFLLEQLWTEDINQHTKTLRFRNELTHKIRVASGEEYFELPKNIDFCKVADGIVMRIMPAYIEDENACHVFDIDWNYPITACAFVLYKYILEENGKVYIEISGRGKMPEYSFYQYHNGQNYFVFLYRLLKLQKCYSWIVLSDIIKDTVGAFEKLLLEQKRGGNALMRLDCKLHRNNAEPINHSYWSKVIDGLAKGRELRAILSDMLNCELKNVVINERFQINLYQNAFKRRCLCMKEESLELWCVRDKKFCGIVIDRGYSEVIERAFFLANFLQDLLLEDGLFSVPNNNSDSNTLQGIEQIVMLVLKNKQQDRAVFQEWLKISEGVVKGVQIISKDIM